MRDVVILEIERPPLFGYDLIEPVKQDGTVYFHLSDAFQPLTFHSDGGNGDPYRAARLLERPLSGDDFNPAGIPWRTREVHASTPAGAISALRQAERVRMECWHSALAFCAVSRAVGRFNPHAAMSHGEGERDCSVALFYFGALHVADRCWLENVSGRMRSSLNSADPGRKFNMRELEVQMLFEIGRKGFNSPDHKGGHSGRWHRLGGRLADDHLVVEGRRHVLNDAGRALLDAFPKEWEDRNYVERYRDWGRRGPYDALDDINAYFRDFTAVLSPGRAAGHRPSP